MSRLIYIHVPKCGGSSFGSALRIRYFASHGAIPLNQGDQTLPKAERIESDYAARGAQLRELVTQRKQFITGHVQYDRELHDGPAAGYRFVTLLRDPVERFVSHYNYLQRKHPDPNRPNELSDFLETSDARRIASQYLFYFAGVTSDNSVNLTQDIETAQQNLQRFDLVGNLAEPDAFSRALRHITRLPIMKWRRNAAPHATHIPAHLHGKIEDICQADIQIFNAIHPAKTRAA